MRGNDALPGEYIDKTRIITTADRMTAAKELLERRLRQIRRQTQAPSSPPSQVFDYVPRDTQVLARYIRERTEDGIEAVRFLLR